MVEVFKTNVQEADESTWVVRQLLNQFPGSRINFDLEDCDRILRIENAPVANDVIISILNASGYQCEVLG